VECEGAPRDLGRDQAVAAIAPMINRVVGELGADKVRAVLPVLRELRVKLEQGD